MRIAVHEQDRFPEFQGEVAQRIAESGEPIPLAPEHSFEIRVGLREDQHAGQVALARQPQAVIEPGEHRRHPNAVFGVHGGGPAEVVVAALHVESDE